MFRTANWAIFKIGCTSIKKTNNSRFPGPNNVPINESWSTVLIPQKCCNRQILYSASPKKTLTCFAVVHFIRFEHLLVCGALAVHGGASQTCILPPGCRPSGCCAPGQKRCSPAAAGGGWPPAPAAVAHAAGCPADPAGPPSPAPAVRPPAPPGRAPAQRTRPPGRTRAARPPAPPHAAVLSPGRGSDAQAQLSVSGWSAPAGQPEVSEETVVGSVIEKYYLVQLHGLQFSLSSNKIL